MHSLKQKVEEVLHYLLVDDCSDIKLDKSHKLISKLNTFDVHLKILDHWATVPSAFH